MLDDYKDVFPNKLYGLPPQHSVDHEINLEPGQSPPFGPLYKMSYPELDELKKQLQEMTDQGIIRPQSLTFWSSHSFYQKERWHNAHVCRLQGSQQTHDQKQVPPPKN